MPYDYTQPWWRMFTTQQNQPGVSRQAPPSGYPSTAAPATSSNLPPPPQTELPQGMWSRAGQALRNNPGQVATFLGTLGKAMTAGRSTYPSSIYGPPIERPTVAGALADMGYQAGQSRLEQDYMATGKAGALTFLDPQRAAQVRQERFIQEESRLGKEERAAAEQTRQLERRQDRFDRALDRMWANEQDVQNNNQAMNREYARAELMKQMEDYRSWLGKETALFEAALARSMAPRGEGDGLGRARLVLDALKFQSELEEGKAGGVTAATKRNDIFQKNFDISFRALMKSADDRVQASSKIADETVNLSMNVDARKALYAGYAETLQSQWGDRLREVTGQMVAGDENGLRLVTVPLEGDERTRAQAGALGMPVQQESKPPVGAPSYAGAAASQLIDSLMGGFGGGSSAPAGPPPTLGPPPAVGNITAPPGISREKQVKGDLARLTAFGAPPEGDEEALVGDRRYRWDGQAWQLVQ